jgi:hypothetical protein
MEKSDVISLDAEIVDGESVLSVEKASTKDVINAQFTTAAWLEDLSAPNDTEVITNVEKTFAREAFKSIAVDGDDAKQKAALMTLNTPAAVMHLTGMLTAYDWEFVNHAKELRGYTVAKILEETNNPNANVRLKALQMLGNVTEVGLFTERVEITKKDASESELEERLRERLSRMIKPPPAEVVEILELPKSVKK